MSETKAQISSGRKLTPIWILPMVALAMGLWALFYSLSNEGPEVQVRFSTAAGLTAGKTKVKFRDVEVGTVTEVRLSTDQEAVVAVLKLDKETEDLMREDTRFWVVTARVSGTNISGLDTLLSGAYIEFAPGETGKKTDEFVGLDAPPQTPAGAPGLRVTLLSNSTHSVSAGDPVLYRGYTVGRVEKREFRLEERKIEYQIFIDEPFHELVDSSVRFWDASGVSFNASADGFELNTASLEAILVGGVSFGRPTGFDNGVAVNNGETFRLYSSREDAETDPYRHGKFYVVNFAQSLRGLTPGAPVEYRGIKMGYVVKIMVEELMSTSEPGAGLAIPVLIRIEPGRLRNGDNPEMVQMLDDSLHAGVDNGMRASLNTGNLLTGSLYVEIDYYPDEPPASIGNYIGYPTIPSVAGGFSRIGNQVTTLLESINDMPLDETVTGVNETLAEFTATLASLRELLEHDQTQTLTLELQALLKELRELVQGVSPESAVYQSLDASLRELNRTLGNLTNLTETLSAKPNSVVMPVDIPADPIPEARP